MFQTRRQIKTKKTLEKYDKIYKAVQDGVELKDLWKEYKYKNEKSLTSAYYQFIEPKYKKI